MTTIKCEKGATLVEFVLVLPLLLLFTFAIIEFGILMYDKAMITLGSREAARAAIVWRPNNAPLPTFLDTTAIEVVADNFLGVVGLKPPSRLISFGDETTSLGPYVIQWSSDKDNWPVITSPPVAMTFDPDTHEYMRVIIQYRYDWLVLQALWFIGFPEGLNLAGETIMRMENPNPS
ncbi:MAG: Flp pilus assembly protein TadG [Desulforhopalus sp.]|jgi:Flp pilus assembly protein TadG